MTPQPQGDSGFMVIRGGKVVAKSKPLQHYFDCPLQFGAFPEFVEATDTADMADTYSIPLSPGDVIIAGTRDSCMSCFHSCRRTPASSACTNRSDHGGWHLQLLHNSMSL